MNKFWKFVNKVSGEGSSNLYLEGEIASETWWGDEVTPEAFRTELRQMKGDLTVHLNSPGGDVFAGVAIYNALKDYTKGKVVVKVDGLAASIASVVAMAGDEIIMSPGSMMMIHNPWSVGVGSSDELRKAADTLDQIKDSILPIYTDRSGLSEDEVKDLMDAETWMTAEKAVELGFADTVQKATKDEKETVNLMYSNFAFSMSATKSAMKDFINKFNNSERKASMNDDEKLKETEAEVKTEETQEVEAPVEEVAEIKDSAECTEENECAEEKAEDGETAEGEAEAEETTEAPAEDENAEEGENAEEEAVEEEGEDIADKIEAEIKALKDENAALKAEIEALKDAKSKAEAKASAKDELQARLTAVLNMAEQADGGDVEGEKEDTKPVDTYGNALEEAFKELN